MLSILFLLGLGVSGSATGQAAEWRQVAYEDGQPVFYRVQLRPGALPELIEERVVSESEATSLSRPVFTKFHGKAGDGPAVSAPLPTRPGFLWEVTQAWSWEWELRYAEWIASEVDEQFFVKYQIKTDCADVAVALRWIFSRMHGLPAAFSLMGSGQIFHPDVYNARWENLEKAPEWHQDRRFLASLEYVKRLTYTHTLFADSYPVAIQPETFLPGIHYLTIGGNSGHTRVVARIDLSDDTSDPIRILASTVPAEVRALYMSSLDAYGPGTPADAGLQRIRWPVRGSSGEWLLQPADAHSTYSLEQYSLPGAEGDRFTDRLIKKLNPRIDFGRTLGTKLESVRNLFIARIQIVEQGFQACLITSCAPGTPGWEAYSTPSRDAHLLEAIEGLEQLAARLSGRTDLSEMWNRERVRPFLELAGASYSLETLIYAWKRKWPQSDPTVSVEARWGLSPAQVGLRLQERLTALLKERVEAHAQADRFCGGGCAMNSEAWRQGQTFTIDGKIRTELQAVDEFIRTFAPGVRAAYHQAEAALVFQVNQLAVTLSQLREQMPFWSADPRDTQAWKWGQVPAGYQVRRIPFEYGDTLGVSRLRRAVRTAMPVEGQRRRITVRDLITDSELAPPAGMQWRSFSLKTDWGIAVADVGDASLEVAVVAPDQRVVERYTVPRTAENTISWATPRALVRQMYSRNGSSNPLAEISLYGLDGSIQVVRDIPLTFTPNSDQDIFSWVAPDTSGQTHFVKIEDGQLLMRPLNLRPTPEQPLDISGDGLNFICPPGASYCLVTVYSYQAEHNRHIQRVFRYDYSQDRLRLLLSVENGQGFVDFPRGGRMVRWASNQGPSVLSVVGPEGLVQVGEFRDWTGLGDEAVARTCATCPREILTLKDDGVERRPLAAALQTASFSRVKDGIAYVSSTTSLAAYAWDALDGEPIFTTNCPENCSWAVWSSALRLNPGITFSVQSEWMAQVYDSQLGWDRALLSGNSGGMGLDLSEILQGILAPIYGREVFWMERIAE